MKIFKLKKCFYILFLIFLIILMKLKIFNINKNVIINKKILIEVDISGSKGSRGPSMFNKGIYEILPYNISRCNFIASNSIYPNNSRNRTDYFYISYPLFGEHIYNERIKINETNKLILGPNFVPSNWYSFPNKKHWKERRFPEIINEVKGIAVHTNRVKNHLSEKSNTQNMIKKYINIRPCTNLKPTNIKSFDNRTIDILFFEKYADLNRKKQGLQLLNLLKNTNKKVKQLKYGYYTKNQMKELANDSKFLIYFSFFDAGPIGLIEIQNHGVIIFTHQKEFVLDNNTSFFVPELANSNDMKNAFNIIMEKIEVISKSLPNSKIIAKINQENNKCEKSLEDLCQSLL